MKGAIKLTNYIITIPEYTSLCSKYPQYGDQPHRKPVSCKLNHLSNTKPNSKAIKENVSLDFGFSSFGPLQLRKSFTIPFLASVHSEQQQLFNMGSSWKEQTYQGGRWLKEYMLGEMIRSREVEF